MGLKILVVDDDEIVILINKTFIQKSKMGDPITFLSAKAVLDYLIKNQNSGDQYLIFLDIHMPEMDAWEFLDNIKMLSAQVFVVIVTSSINKIDKEKANPYKNIIAFLEKPIKKQDCEQLKLLPELSGFF